MADVLRWRILVVEETTSTNDDVRLAADQGEPDGFVLRANHQLSGRGRHGRVWNSPEGNLYTSILLRPNASHKNYGHYSFITALAIYDVVKASAPKSPVTLKWPNDVLVDGCKIAGILLEAGPDYLIIGIGLNVAQYPDDVRTAATSLDHIGANISVETALDNLLAALGRWLDDYNDNGFLPIRNAWMLRAHKGEITVKLPNEKLDGMMLGVDEGGALRLGLADGTERVISSGEVFLGTGQG